MEKVVIIGAGPAGMMAAIEASKKYDVTILEKKEKVGMKLRITGKGRCNITFKGDSEYFFSHILENQKFMLSSFNLFNNNDLTKFANGMGVKTKEERGNRIFLQSDNAEELADKMLNRLKKCKVNIRYNSPVENVEKTEDGRVCITLFGGEKIIAKKCIIATGGKSYPATGSTGDGFKIAEKLGHTVSLLRPGLVGLKSNDSACKELQGLTLKNVAITLKNDGKEVYSDFGEMMFSHFGVTGPVILSCSSKLVRESNYTEKLRNSSIVLKVDLKPALDFDVLDKRVQRDFEKYNTKELKNALVDLLPKKMIIPVIQKSKLDGNKKVCSITKEERQKLISVLKGFEIIITDTMPIETGIVTVGGINLKEINPKTLESKIVPNIYFVGEILDLDALTGGFNLQIAFSTGYACGYYLSN
ncbi:MAG: NAD(P)/FAD-dependent oxidoreductase [Clostridia bacterium]|nr:NAD(P)/FAD-dependent oxidoreductase [Clostridia bacterium]